MAWDQRRMSWDMRLSARPSFVANSRKQVRRRLPAKEAFVMSCEPLLPPRRAFVAWWAADRRTRVVTVTIVRRNSADYEARGLCHGEFQGSPEDAQNWFVGSADIKNAFHQMRIPGWLQAFFALLAVLASEVGPHRKNGRPKTSCPRFFDRSCLYNTSPWVSLGRCFLSTCHGPPLALGEVRILLFSLSALLLLGSKRGLGSVWLAEQTVPTFISYVSLHVFQKAGLDVHDTSLASGSAGVLGYEVSPANAYCSGPKSMWRNHVFFAVIGVFVGSTFASVRMHQKWALCSRFVTVVASWLRRLVGSQSGTRFKRSTRSIRAWSRALRSIAPDVNLECSSSDDNEVSLAQRERCAYCNFLDPSEWRLVAHGGFFRKENITVLEARSILYAVRYSESCCPPGRLLILSDHLPLVLALCKGRSKQITWLSVMRRIFASGFRAGFVLSFRWTPSVSNYSDKTTRFFDRDCDPSK